MSSTRRSSNGAFHQERFCSAPEFEGNTIKGLAAAKRIALVQDAGTRELLWWIQQRSIEPDGLQSLRDELVSLFPERIGAETMRKVLARRSKKATLAECAQMRSESGFYKITSREDREFFRSVRGRGTWVVEECKPPTPDELLEKAKSDAAHAVANCLRRHLMECCLDPSNELTKSPWYFADLRGALKIARERSIEAARTRLADTDVTRKIIDTLDFGFARRRMVLIEGVAGIGRTATTHAWCDATGGLFRYVEIPSSSDDRSFFASIARQLGVACGASYKAQQIKVRVEEMLSVSGIGLALDEAQYAWGQFIRPRRTPDRILWIKTILDAGTPIALIAHTDFSKWQAHYVKQTLWTDEQFVRRVNRHVVLPTEHSREDILAIARAHFPDGDSRSWKLLASYALGTEKKQASGIVEALESARYRAQKDGRAEANFADIKEALTHDHGFLRPAPADDLQPACTGVANGVKRESAVRGSRRNFDLIGGDSRHRSGVPAAVET